MRAGGGPLPRIGAELLDEEPGQVMEEGLAVQSDDLLPADLGTGSRGGGHQQPETRPKRRGVGSPVKWGGEEAGDAKPLVGAGPHLVHDPDVSRMRPEAVVHRDEGQALPAARMRGSYRGAAPRGPLLTIHTSPNPHH